MTGPGGYDTAGATLARRLELIAAAATTGAGVMAVLWGVAGRNVGPEAPGAAAFTASVSLWWGLFAVVGIAAALGAFLAGRGDVDAGRGLRWGALLLSVGLLALGRWVGAIPF